MYDIRYPPNQVGVDESTPYFFLLARSSASSLLTIARFHELSSDNGSCIQSSALPRMTLAIATDASFI